MLVVGADAVELLEQIEDDIGLPVDDGAAQLREAVRHSQRHDFVARRFQMGDHVVFGAPFVDLLLGGPDQRVGRHEGGVHQHQRALFLHSCRSS